MLVSQQTYFSLCSIRPQRLDDASDGWMTVAQQTLKPAFPSLSEVFAGSISIIDSQLMYTFHVVDGKRTLISVS